MTPSLFRTGITELFGIDHPLLCGGLMWLADANYVGAVVNAGGMGFITPRSFPSDEAYRDQLKKCRDITGGTNFGVNIYVSARPEANEALARLLDIAIEEGVRNVETAGFSPKAFMPRIKDAGMRVIHKCTTVRHAQSAVRAGVDAICLLGAEAGGHPGMDMIGGMVQGALAAQALDVPFVLGGGMGTGRQLVAALALGADGILLGSRMTVSEEIWADEKYKQRVVEAVVSDTRIVMSIFNDNSRVLDNETARAVVALEADGITDFDSYRPLVEGIIQREAYAAGDPERGTLSMGQSCAFADRIESVEAIFDRILVDAGDARERMKKLDV
jgi:NAD(P)H-dependent flavin oxidoreductase YrpB (nitropropane dioxygenase family)